jgi:hypothetical protein
MSEVAAGLIRGCVLSGNEAVDTVYTVNRVFFVSLLDYTYF